MVTTNTQDFDPKLDSIVLLPVEKIYKDPSEVTYHTVFVPKPNFTTNLIEGVLDEVLHHRVAPFYYLTTGPRLAPRT